jgi:hypothetical protein
MQTKNAALTLSRRALLPMAASAAAWSALAPSAWAVGAVKHYILINLKPGADMLMLDRWYLTYHAPQVRRAFKAWQRNYTSFHAYLPPDEATARYPTLGYGRMTEIHFDTFEDFQETRPRNIYGELSSFTPPPGGWGDGNSVYESTSITMPVNPNELYVSKPTPPKENPYFRWIVFINYPQGVTHDEGDKWWSSVHAPELAKLPTLMRFGWYKVVRPNAEYVRVAEFWFEDYQGWRSAFLNPKFAAPRWSSRFPFYDTISMFVGENPDIDFVNDKRVVP